MHPGRFFTDGALRFIHRSHGVQYGDHDTQALSSAISSNRWGALWPRHAWMDAGLLASGHHDPDRRSISGGGLGASGPRGADGGHVGPIGGRNPDGSPRFDQAVPPGGYLWWYVDALSDDGQFGLTIIAFVGSVFSPYYHWAFQRNKAADPENHCCINVALYGRGVRRWTMTERSRASMERDSRHFRVGPSQLRWTGSHLEIDLHEWSAPIPRAVHGTIKVFPDKLFHFVTALDDGALHHWGPIAPSARVEVTLERPRLSWKGHAYLDSNEGVEPTIDRFTEWDWSRARLSDGSVAVLYDIRQKSGAERLLALKFNRDQSVESFPAPPRQALPKALWRVGRSVRTDPGRPARVLQTLEDTPFYVRSVLESGLLGEKIVSMHETLNIPRLDTASTRLMLPWKMPRVR